MSHVRAAKNSHLQKICLGTDINIDIEEVLNKKLFENDLSHPHTSKQAERTYFDAVLNYQYLIEPLDVDQRVRLSAITYFLAYFLG